MIAKLSLTAAALGIAFPVAAGPAHAQYRWHGGYGGAVGAGIAGFAAGALLGDAIAGSRYYGYGPGYYGYAPGYYEDGYAPGDDDYAQGTVNSASGPTIRARACIRAPTRCPLRMGGRLGYRVVRLRCKAF